MAVGKQNRIFNGKTFSVKLSIKDGAAFLDVARFNFQKKGPDGGKYINFTPTELKDSFGTEGPIHDLKGDLVSIETNVGEFEGGPIYNVTLGLVDNSVNEKYYIGYVVSSNLGRNLSNTLLSLTTFGSVNLGLWGQENKITKKTYPAISVRLGDSKETVKWKYDPKTTAELQPRLFEGKDFKRTQKLEKDYGDADLWLFNKVKEFGEQIRSNTPVQSNISGETPVPVNSGGTEDSDENVPF